MIKIGDKVLCRLYNTPEQRFYGASFVGTIVDIRVKSIPGYCGSWREYFVKPDDRVRPIWLIRKEVKRIIK